MDVSRRERRWSIASVCVALAGLCAFVELQSLDYDFAWLAFAGVALVVTPALVVLAIASRNVFGIAIVVGFVAVAWMLLTNDMHPMREKIRWVAFASQYKSEVLASTDRSRGQLRHAEWDGGGFAGMETEEYVVFDPHDSLLAASRLKSPGKPPGIPCEVESVQRLEPGWYSVCFFTSTDWDFCGQ